MPVDHFTFSPDKKRCARQVPFGFACYEFLHALDEDPDHWTYSHAGVAESEEDAKEFLRGNPVDLLEIYPL